MPTSETDPRERVFYRLDWDDCSQPNGWRIFRSGFSGRSVADDRIWSRREFEAAETALAEFIKEQAK